MNEEMKKDETEIKEEVNKENSDYDISSVFTETEGDSSVSEEVEGEDTSDTEEEVVEGETLTPTENIDEPEVGTDGDINEVHDESQNAAEKMVAQSKVNEIAARARQEGRDSALKELLAKYGVGSDTELDDLFGKGQSYVDLDNEYNAQRQSYSDALAENALLKTRINQDRWEDVKLILGGKGLEITPENIEMYLVSHPEWRTMGVTESNVLTPEMGEQLAQNIGNNNAVNQKATLRKLGNEASPEPTLSEEELARKLYGFK